MQLRFLVAMLMLIVAAQGGEARAADEMSVQVKTTQVRDRGSYLGKVLYPLHYGDRVMVLQRGAAWYKIRPILKSEAEIDEDGKKNQGGRTAGDTEDAGHAGDEKNDKAEVKGLTGFLNKSALTTKRIVLRNDPNAQVLASSDNVVLAGKGFNDEVEQAYRGDHPSLNSAYSILDEIEMDSTYSPSAEDVNAFRTAGGLGGGEA